MFGGLAHLIPTPSLATSPPKDVPPPTPINFPCCEPQVNESDGGASGTTGSRPKPLTAFLQDIVRPMEVDISHFEALGVHVTSDVSPDDLIPDPLVIPDFAGWESLSQDEAHAANEQTRRPLNNGGLSPGVITYLDRRRELSTANEAAFRAVRRIAPPPGQTQVRLGNSFEFFRNLEVFSNFWDDTSRPIPEPAATEEVAENGDKADTIDESSTADESGKTKDAPQHSFRTAAGSMMPPEYRHNIITAFLKLVAYDFGCNVSAPRTEPRLYLNVPSSPGPSSPDPVSSISPVLAAPGQTLSTQPRSSYFSSGCAFIFRTPITRAEARAGVVEGPVAAVSARHTTTFPSLGSPISTGPESARSGAYTADKDSTVDLARELVAALLTAQHRRREGRTEKRIGEGAWWASKPRWGGGTGGPIGREVDASGGEDVVGDKDEIPSDKSTGSGATVAIPNAGATPNATTASGTITASGIGNRTPGATKPASKKARRNMAIYDNYRAVRPPSPAWDKKTRYAALGRRRGAAWDDIFIVSALFHHVAVLRVRVPDRLLDVLDGAPEDGAPEDGAPVASGPVAGPKSWGRLDVARSRWFDFFAVEERVAAMKLVWGMMAYLMRKDDDGDVAMADA